MSAAGPNWIENLAAQPVPPQRAAFGLCGDFGLRWVNYAQFWSNARRASGLLAAAGIEPGSRILLWGSNTPEWVACLMGALLRGVVVVPLDVDSPRDNVARIAAETSAKLVWGSAETDPSFLQLPFWPLESIAEAAEPADELTIAVKAEDAAAILYTSGTTAQPRGVILSHGNIQAQLAGFAGWRVLLRSVSFRMLVIAPLSHVQGLILGALLPVSLGLSIVFVRSVHPAQLLRIIRDYRITLLSTVPRVLHVLTQTMAARSSGVRHLTIGEWLATEERGWMRRHIMFTRMNAAIGRRFWVILVGGAALLRYDEQFWRDAGRIVVQGYGLTETTAIAALNGPLSRRVGSVGKPLGSVSLKIAEDGEILVRGATVTPGYFGEYLRTGDLARWDKGRIYFLGRKKDTIVTGEGFNVYPSDIETLLLRTPGVVDAVVLGRETADGEEVHAVLLLRGGADPARTIAAVNEKLAPYQRVLGWNVWPDPDFPRTALMKVRRDEVARALADMDSRRSRAEVQTLTVEAVAAESDRETRVRRLAQWLLEAPPESIAKHRSRSLADLGLSSLDTVALITELERRSGLWLNHAILPAQATIADARNLAQDTQPRGAARRLPSRQPVWASSAIGRTLRWLGRPLAVGYWSLFCASVTASWESDPRRLPSQFLLAAAPHRHWLDAFAICSALPRKSARRLLMVTNRNFHEFFEPTPAVRLNERLTVGLAYYAGMPLTFPFTIVPHEGSTRQGLFETARMIDRGHCPLSFPKGFAFDQEFSDRHDPGMAVLAAECNLPIVPVWIMGNGGLGLLPGRSRKVVKLAFGTPIPPDLRRTPEETMGMLETKWQQMRRPEKSG
jgi:long-chain acyl-CoA synthetase